MQEWAAWVQAGVGVKGIRAQRYKEHGSLEGSCPQVQSARTLPIFGVDVPLTLWKLQFGPYQTDATRCLPDASAPFFSLKTKT